MLNFFVRRPITTIMFVLFWVVLGIVSFPKMNIERTPPMDLPLVTARFVYPGATPSEIESQILKRAEDAVSQVAGLKKITSRAFENGGYVMGEFNLGVDANEKATEVKSKLDALLQEFPSDMENPVVEKLNPLQQSVVDIVIRGADARDVEKYVDDILATRITALPGVAGVSSFGGRSRAVRVAMNPDLMAARGVTIMDIVSAIGSHNLNVPGGKIETAASAQNVRLIGEFASVDEIRALRITTVEGDNFALGDVADVTDGARDADTGARYDGTDVVIVSVVKASDGNAIKISRALHKKMPEFQADLQSHFDGATMTIATDTSTSISDETYDTIYSIVLGVLFTVLVLLAFTRNWRSTVIAGVVIPASLLAGFFFMDMFGFSVNAMTLLAYSSALGTLVSNAIILIEAALQEMRNGKDPINAAIDGTRSVAVPVLAGVGTNVVVFLPLAFMGGIVGLFMMQFGMTVVFVTLLSLLFSFTLAPMMIGQILRLVKTPRAARETTRQKEARNDMPRFRKIFDFQHSHPWIVVAGAFVVLVASAMLTRFLGNEFSPSTDTNEINMTVRAPMGSTYEKSAEIAREVERVLTEFDQVKAVVIKIGDEGVQNIDARVELVDRSQRGISDKALVQKMLPALATIPDAEIQIRAGAAMSSSSDADIVLDIHGEDDALREEYALRAVELINQIEEVQSAVLAQQVPADEVRFIPDADRMNFWGVKNAYAGAVLRAALYGNDDYKYKENGDEYPIIIEFAKPFKTADMFDGVYVNSAKGLVPLASLGTIERVRATPDIRRLDKNRITEINVNIGKSTVGPVQKKIEDALATLDWREGYGSSFGGMAEIQSETTGEIGSAFMLAAILTFMLLAAILNSLAHPVTIATSIITSFAGVFVVMFLVGASVNVGAMLAFVMLVGLVVNNNILILEPTVARVANGEAPYDALWAEFGSKRRMVLMTSIAIITGMLPQLWSADGMKSSMGAVMVGGMMASLVWTFMLTPALFFLIERARSRLHRKR